MQDPSNGIHRDLLPHVHLVCTYRFPVLQNLHPDKVTEYLLAAPKIARDQATFYWTYLDQPQDGTILLVYQSPSLGTDAPSDGYIWPPAEIAFQQEVNGGYILEVHQHKSGFGPREQFTLHQRRRYRLLPKFPNANGNPDPSLWLIHYSQAEPQDRIPSGAIQIDARVQNTIRTRGFLQQAGQIIQKEFMLHDRPNWPTIQFPAPNPNARNMYPPGGAQPVRVPPTMAYPPHHSVAGAPQAKRIRTQANVNPNMAGGAMAILDDDEEETGRGDLFDLITPREVSQSRYKQNHLWMEEILSSPYAMHQIVPADLGLGFRGELAGLTDGFFDAPYNPDEDVSKHNYVGRLDPEKAAEFRQRAKERAEQAEKETEKMRKKHAKRLAKFQRGSLLLRAERELRTAVSDPADVGPEDWRLEGKVDAEDSEETKSSSAAPSKVDDIIAQVEATLGRHAVAVEELRRIQDGGYEEAAPLPPTPPPVTTSPQKQAGISMIGTPQSGVLVTDADMDLGNSAAGLLDQYHTGPSSNATPGSNFNTPQAHLQGLSASGTPNMQVPSPLPQSSTQQQGDVTMSEGNEQAGSADALGTSDWVVVPPGGVSPSAAAPTPSNGASMGGANAAATGPGPTDNNNPLPDFSTSPNDFGDLGDLDTAGEALAGYGDENTGLGDDLGLDMGLDDSAFGEAFHGVEPRGDEESGEAM